MKKSMSVIFNSDLSGILICSDKVSGKLSFIEGNRSDTDVDMIDGAYRVLFDKSGLSVSDVTLLPVRVEKYCSFNGEKGKLYLTTGILSRDVTLIPSKDSYVRWLDLSGIGVLLSKSFEGYGRAYSYYLECAEKLGIDVYRFDA